MAPPTEAGHRSRNYSILVTSHLRSSLHYKILWTELSGALGDLGTFVPIVIALTLVDGLDLGTTLLFTGVYNIITGLLFGVPMPVQPMKSIAAVAITQGSPLTVSQIMAAGITCAGFMFVIGVTGLMGFVHKIMPLPVVRGIQLSQGLSFGNTAVKYVLKQQDFAKGKSMGDRQWLGLDGILLAVIAFCFIVVATGSGDNFSRDQRLGHEVLQLREQEDANEEEITDEESRLLQASRDDAMEGPRRLTIVPRTRIEALPTAIIVFLLGIILAFIRKPGILKELQLGPSKPHLVKISKSDWKIGFVRGAIPQIPLSVLNSVIAVCKLSSDLFPNKNVSPTAVSTSVGLMNLVGCWFGAMPVCHGAGGLAGQCRFGARSGAAVVFLGTGKVFLSLLLGSSLVKILSEFPIGLLGILLLFSGVELAMACRDQNTRLDSFVMLVCTVVSLASSNAGLGFGCGLCLFVLLKLRDVDFTSCWIKLKESLFGSKSADDSAEMGYQECRSAP